MHGLLSYTDQCEILFIRVVADRQRKPGSEDSDVLETFIGMVTPVVYAYVDAGAIYGLVPDGFWT
jgi:hypothetical protein